MISIEITIPDELYKQASTFFAKEGTTVEAVAAAFIRYVVTYGELPFEVRKGVVHEGNDESQLSTVMEASDR